MATRSIVKPVVFLAKDRRFVQHVRRDHIQVIIIHIVSSVRLDTTVVEECNCLAISVPSPLQVLGIVLRAVVDTFVMEINERFVLQVPSVMDPSLAALLVHQEPSVQEKVTRLLLLVMTVSILVVTPLHVKSVKKGSYVRRELKETVQQGKLVSGGLPVNAVLVTTLMVEGVLVNRVRLESTTPRVRHQVRMTAPLVLFI